MYSTQGNWIMKMLQKNMLFITIIITLVYFKNDIFVAV